MQSPLPQISPNAFALAAAAILFLGGLLFIYLLSRKDQMELGSNNVRALGVVVLIPAVLVVAGLGLTEGSDIIAILGTFGGFILGRETASARA